MLHGRRETSTAPSATFRSCFDFAPRIRNLEENLAIIYTRRGGRYGLEKDYDRAIADLSKALEIDPLKEESRRLSLSPITRGEHSMGRRRTMIRAIADLSKALEIDPKHEDSRKNLVTRL